MIVGGVLTLGAVRVEANGRFPRAQFLTVGPGRSDELFALRSTFGLVLSDDGGQRFRFFCEEAYQIPDGFDPMLAWTSDGTLLVGTPTGLSATRDLCDPVRRREFEGQDVVDLAGDATGRVTLVAMQSRDAVPVLRVARTEDAGATWEVFREGFRAEVALTVEVAPSNPRRAYLTSEEWQGAGVVLRRSEDGGRTWRASAFRFPGRPFLAGVHPLRPEVLYVRVELPLPVLDGGVLGGGSVLLQSDDGGEHFREVGRTRGAMLGFALSGDGRHVWVGGPDGDDGLQRSDDGGPFVQVNPVGVDCLRWHAGVLYACETLGGVRGTALLSRSTDLGVTRHVMLRMEDVLPPPQRCPQGSIVRGFCNERWPAVRSFVLGQARGDAGPPDAARSMDATADGAGVGRDPEGGGCACGTTPARSAQRLGWGPAVWVMLTRRRRGRGAAAPTSTP